MLIKQVKCIAHRDDECLYLWLARGRCRVPEIPPALLD